jgi:hypothetical protein
MTGNVVLVRFIGQSGVVRNTISGKNVTGYRFRPDDTYIRAEILSPNTTIVLNPVIRTTNGSLPQASATVNVVKTVLWLMLWLIAYGGLAFMLFRRYFRAKSIEKNAVKKC